MKRRSFFKTVAHALAALPFIGKTASADDGLKFIEHTGRDIESNRMGEYIANDKPAVHLPGREEIVFTAHDESHKWKIGDVIQVKEYANHCGYGGRYRFSMKETLDEPGGIPGMCRFTLVKIDNTIYE